MTPFGRWLRAGAALGLAAWIVLGAAGPVRAQDQAAPGYTARILGSEEQAALAELRGKVVLLNTWATWCEPCREEMPAFETLYRRHRDDGLVVVGVNIDEGRADGAASRYVERAGLSFPIWRDPANRFAKQFRVLGPPETFLVDRDGRIRFHWAGPNGPRGAP